MIDSYEQKKIINYLQNLLNRTLSRQALDKVCTFLETALPLLGAEDKADDLLETIDNYRCAADSKALSRTVMKKLLVDICSFLTRRSQTIEEAPCGAFAANLQVLTDEIGLNALESGVLGLFLRYRIYDQLSTLLNDLTSDHIAPIDLCATCLGAAPGQLMNVLGPQAPLITSGVIIQYGRSWSKGLDDYMDVPDIIVESMCKAMVCPDDVRLYILGKPQAATLEWSDFTHLGKTLDKLTLFLRQVCEQKIPGVNILLWGAPGTGKTEFSKTLARQLRLNLYSVGEKSDVGDELSGRDRIAALRISQKLLKSGQNNLLLFDEMDDVFTQENYLIRNGKKYVASSKIYINRLLENNPVPTIWTINDPSQLEESIIRRMALAIEMRVPTASSRRQVWQRMLDKNQVAVSAEVITKLAQIDISPAVADRAVSFAALVGATMDDFQFVTQGIIKATRGYVPQTLNMASEPYVPALINAEMDIDLLAEQLCQASSRNFSLCLFGPPGTGKSAYARYLAERLGMTVLAKRGSDLISPFIGTTEKNIAAAFEEAAESQSLLIFDEADSFLGDRRTFKNSWEITQVNEMLTWMESHQLPFACTTNLKNRLDQASLRRFTFKCHFDYMKPAQVIIAFKDFFGVEVDVHQVSSMVNLTPGDFAVVRKKLRFLGIDPNYDALLELLMAEVSAKNEVLRKPLGFMVSQ